MPGLNMEKSEEKENNGVGPITGPSVCGTGTSTSSEFMEESALNIEFKTSSSAPENTDPSVCMSVTEGNYQDLSGVPERRGMTKELMQLAFKNPGPLMSAAFDFSPEQLSNREKRKLNRLMERGTRSKEAAKLKGKKQQALHDSSGCLVSNGRDLCDCQDPECPGCHYACPQCGSEKCGTVCRCDRKWTYDQIDVYNKERTFSR